MRAVARTLELLEQSSALLSVHDRSPDLMDSTSRQRCPVSEASFGSLVDEEFRLPALEHLSLESPLWSAKESHPTQRSLKGVHFDPTLEIPKTVFIPYFSTILMIA
jgi:hypothetical protein